MVGRARTTQVPVSGDPWSGFGYIVSGVAVYGVIGWALGGWLEARWLTPVGILFGALLGMYLVYVRFGRVVDDHPQVPRRPTAPTDRPTADAQTTGPAATRRGEDA